MENISARNKLYQTSEYTLGAVLMTCGFRLENINWIDRNRAQFEFRYIKSMDEIANAFWQGTLTVPVIPFCQNLKLLKARLRNEIR